MQEEILLRTYYGFDPQTLPETMSVLDALLATTAAMVPLADKDSFPVRFPFKSGGLGWNNPIYHAYREARSIWPDREIVIVSIGAEPRDTHENFRQANHVTNLFKDDHPDMAKDNLFRFEPAGDSWSSSFDQCAKRLWQFDASCD